MKIPNNYEISIRHGTVSSRNIFVYGNINSNDLENPSGLTTLVK